MKIARIFQGMRVEATDGRLGTVISVSKYTVKVQFDGTPEAVSVLPEALKVAKVNPLERDLNAGLHRYSTDYLRALRPWAQDWSSELAWIVGFAAQNNAFLRHSGQPNGGRTVEDEFDFGADSNGEKFDAIMSNPNYAGLDAVLDINFIHRNPSKCGLRTVSLNKEGFWRFLESIGFQVGSNQEQTVAVIRQAVPERYLADFDAGVRGSVPPLAA